jgi:hypothetical protein
MTEIFSNRFGGGSDETLCRAKVAPKGGSWFGLQCQRAPVVQREIGGKTFGFCKLHDPEAVAKRKDERDAKRNAEWAAKNAAWHLEARKKAALPELIAAMKLIAEGHNDARGLAVEMLAKIGDVG